MPVFSDGQLTPTRSATITDYVELPARRTKRPRWRRPRPARPGPRGPGRLAGRHRRLCRRWSGSEHASMSRDTPTGDDPRRRHGRAASAAPAPAEPPHRAASRPRRPARRRRARRTAELAELAHRRRRPAPVGSPRGASSSSPCSPDHARPGHRSTAGSAAYTPLLGWLLGGALFPWASASSSGPRGSCRDGGGPGAARPALHRADRRPPPRPPAGGAGPTGAPAPARRVAARGVGSCARPPAGRCRCWRWARSPGAQLTHRAGARAPGWSTSTATPVNVAELEDRRDRDRLPRGPLRPADGRRPPPC